MNRGDAQEPGEVIAARATVVLDARALNQLGRRRWIGWRSWVERRLMERRAAGQPPLLSIAQAAEVAGVGYETVRGAIRSGALEVAGYVGRRPRQRREAIDAWLAAGRPRQPTAATMRALGRVRRGRRSRVLGDAVAAMVAEGQS